MELVTVRGRCREYFEELLNVEDEGAAVVTTLGRRGPHKSDKSSFQVFSARDKLIATITSPYPH